MDVNKRVILRKRIEKTLKRLEDNQMQAFYVESREDVVPLVKGLISEGQEICSGGSMTLIETGVYDMLKSGNYHYYDREGLSREEVEKVYRKAFSSDVYFCSANAVTENGELYNVDGNSNRVAAICYGPESVIVIAGINKLVRDIDEAVLRVKACAAPANCIRLSCETPCSKTGECISLSTGGDMPSGCHGDGRVCCNYVVSARQRKKNRIKVIIVGEELGY